MYKGLYGVPVQMKFSCVAFTLHPKTETSCLVLETVVNLL